METNEYDVVIKVRLFSMLSKEQLKQELVIALWEGTDDSTLIPDGTTDDLEVVEYLEIDIEEVIHVSSNTLPEM